MLDWRGLLLLTGKSRLKLMMAAADPHDPDATMEFWKGIIQWSVR